MAASQLVSAGQARAAAERTGLTGEQRDALVMMLTATTAATVLAAPAGAGKSHTMAEFARLWTTFTGRRVIGLTTSTNAARVLAHEGLAESYNIAEFLGEVEGSDELRRPVPLHRDDVLVLDEASQLSTSDLAMIGEAARQGGARIIATGDTAQLGAVEAGGMLALLASEVPAAQLHEFRRFVAEWEREASVRLRDGELAAVAAYDRHGRIRAADEETAYDRAASMWLADHLRGKDVLLLAGSNAEAAELSRRVQARLVQVGDVGPPTAVLATATTPGPATWSAPVSTPGSTPAAAHSPTATPSKSPAGGDRTPRSGGSAWTGPGPSRSASPGPTSRTTPSSPTPATSTSPRAAPSTPRLNSNRSPGSSGQQYPRPRRSLSPRHLSRGLRSPRLPDPSPLMKGAPPGSMGCRPARTKPRAASTRSGHSSTPAASTLRGSSGKHRSSRKLPGRQIRPVKWTGRDQAALALTERADILRFQRAARALVSAQLPQASTIRGSVHDPRFRSAVQLSAVQCTAEFIRTGIKAAPAAPLARRQRRALPWAARRTPGHTATFAR